MAITTKKMIDTENIKMIDLIEEKNVNATIVSIEWERVNFYFDVKLEISDGFKEENPFVFYAVNGLDRAKIKFDILSQTGSMYRLKGNITNNGENRCVPCGNYRIILTMGDKQIAECEMSEELACNLEPHSRNFLHGNRHMAYAVTFYTDSMYEGLYLRMHVLPASIMSTSFPNSVAILTSLHPIKNLKQAVGGHKKMLRKIYKFLCRIYKSSRKKNVLFMTEQSSSLTPNLKAVSDRMKERGLDKEYTITFSTRQAAAQPQGKMSWINLMKKLARSDIIFLDDHAPVLDWIKLDPKTQLIQLWHAGAGFKSSGYSRWGCVGGPKSESCHRQYKYGIAGSEKIAPFFAEVWGINKEQVLPTGMPRIDEYLNEQYKQNKIKEIYSKYPLAKGKKVILFAPTYRGNTQRSAYYPYDILDMKRLYNMCGDEYIVLFKMHPWVNENININKKHKDRFIEVKDYPKINDLFYITDLLITDYSSSIFEFSLMKKPTLFFAFDKVQYSFSRGFHRDYELSAPGKVCYTFEDLIQAIENKDFEAEKVEKYVHEHFDNIDCNSSDRVIDWIILDKIPESIKNAIETRKTQNEAMNKYDFMRIQETD